MKVILKSLVLIVCNSVLLGFMGIPVNFESVFIFTVGMIFGIFTVKWVFE